MPWSCVVFLTISLCLLFCTSLFCTIVLLGSEMYQETLTKALAKHFDARLLIMDSLMLCGVSPT
jgi:hypothetical protein